MSKTPSLRRWPQSVPPDSALDLMVRGAPPVTGQQIADRYGLLTHYLAATDLATIVAQAQIGGPGDAWLTPTPYAGCVAPYDLGLRSPRDLCMLAPWNSSCPVRSHSSMFAS